jgi:ribosomal protein S18 acetylase RimI-like enzyme
MRRFYYRWLPADGFLVGAVAYVDGQPAGFVVGTSNPTGFMRAALRRRWRRLLWVLATCLILRPHAVGAVLAACRVLRTRRPEPAAAGSAEILSMGVLPEYRTQRFVVESKLRLSMNLVDHIASRLVAAGADTVRAIVAADNPQAKLLYSGLGWTLSRTDVPEWRTPTAEFLWRP